MAVLHQQYLLAGAIENWIVSLRKALMIRNDKKYGVPLIQIWIIWRRCFVVEKSIDNI